MPEVAYPDTLPGPAPGGFAPRPRRVASSLEGPLQQRARQRDAAGLASQYTYVYTPEQMAVWLAWYRDTLIEGRRWFSHDLPGRGGMAQRVVRYLSVRQQLLGSGIYRVEASFEQRGASVEPATEEGDPLWGSVLLLLDASGALTKDSSSYNRTLVDGSSGGGEMVLNTDTVHWGRPTYANLPGNSKLALSPNDSFVRALGTAEWCIEMEVMATAASAADTEPRLCSIGPLEFRWFADGHVTGTCFSIGGSSITLPSSAGARPIGTFGHLALVRDNSDPTFSYLHFYVDGVRVSSSSGESKSANIDSGFNGLGFALAYNNLSPRARFSALRLTGGSARYYDDFTPPSVPFPITGI